MLALVIRPLTMHPFRDGAPWGGCAHVCVGLPFGCLFGNCFSYGRVSALFVLVEAMIEQEKTNNVFLACLSRIFSTAYSMGLGRGGVYSFFCSRLA